MNGINDLKINTDSLYVINVFSNLERYKTQKWKNISNRDLLEVFACWGCDASLVKKLPREHPLIMEADKLARKGHFSQSKA